MSKEGTNFLKKNRSQLKYVDTQEPLDISLGAQLSQERKDHDYLTQKQKLEKQMKEDQKKMKKLELERQLQQLQKELDDIDNMKSKSDKNNQDNFKLQQTPQPPVNKQFSQNNLSNNSNSKSNQSKLNDKKRMSLQDNIVKHQDKVLGRPINVQKRQTIIENDQNGRPVLRLQEINEEDVEKYQNSNQKKQYGNSNNQLQFQQNAYNTSNPSFNNSNQNVNANALSNTNNSNYSNQKNVQNINGGQSQLSQLGTSKQSQQLNSASALISKKNMVQSIPFKGNKHFTPHKQVTQNNLKYTESNNRKSNLNEEQQNQYFENQKENDLKGIVKGSFKSFVKQELKIFITGLIGFIIFLYCIASLGSGQLQTSNYIIYSCLYSLYILESIVVCNIIKIIKQKSKKIADLNNYIQELKFEFPALKIMCTGQHKSDKSMTKTEEKEIEIVEMLDLTSVFHEEFLKDHSFIKINFYSKIDKEDELTKASLQNQTEEVVRQMEDHYENIKTSEKLVFQEPDLTDFIVVFGTDWESYYDNFIFLYVFITMIGMSFIFRIYFYSKLSKYNQTIIKRIFI